MRSVDKRMICLLITFFFIITFNTLAYDPRECEMCIKSRKVWRYCIGGGWTGCNIPHVEDGWCQADAGWCGWPELGRCDTACPTKCEDKDVSICYLPKGYCYNDDNKCIREDYDFCGDDRRCHHCSEIREKSECESKGRCVWIDGKCVIKKPCEKLGKSECESRRDCCWITGMDPFGGSTGKCVDKSSGKCNTWICGYEYCSKENCESVEKCCCVYTPAGAPYTVAQCFDPRTQKCTENGVTTLSCADYGNNEYNCERNPACVFCKQDNSCKNKEKLKKGDPFTNPRGEICEEGKDEQCKPYRHNDFCYYNGKCGVKEKCVCYYASAHISEANCKEGEEPICTNEGWKCKGKCSGTVVLTLSPNPSPPSQKVKATISGLSGCDGKEVYVREGSCSGALKCSCKVSGSGCSCTFTAGGSCNPLSQPTYYACIDKNGDGDYSDEGENDYEVLKMDCGPQAEKGCCQHYSGYCWYATEEDCEISNGEWYGPDYKCENNRCVCKYECCSDYDCGYPSSGKVCRNHKCVEEGPTCSGEVELFISPYLVARGDRIKLKASGLSNCDGKKVEFREGSCSGSLYGSCSILAGSCEFTLTISKSLSYGEHTVYACIDKNGDGDYNDAGEKDSGKFKVTTCEREGGKCMEKPCASYVNCDPVSVTNLDCSGNKPYCCKGSCTSTPSTEEIRISSVSCSLSAGTCTVEITKNTYRTTLRILVWLAESSSGTKRNYYGGAADISAGKTGKISVPLGGGNCPSGTQLEIILHVYKGNQRVARKLEPRGPTC